jgi:hypothetical protein
MEVTKRLIALVPGKGGGAGVVRKSVEKLFVRR